MLSPEERASLLEEALDERRREILRGFRRPPPPPAVLLDLLTGAVELLQPLDRRPRRRPFLPGDYRL